VLAVEKAPTTITSPTLSVVPAPAEEPAPPRDDLPGERYTGETVTGHVRIHKAFQSVWLERTRDIWVYLPPGYETSTERYPVLYMHDGNNLFDAALAFGGREWQVDETAERMITGGELRPIIIVGVSNSPDRMDEYNYTTATLGGQLMGGAGGLYARFLVDEVKAFIDVAYRTMPEQEHTGVAGSSLGGLISLYLAIHHPDTFGRIGIISPSIHWAHESALHTARRIRPGLRIWMDMGWHEDDWHRPPEEIKQLRALRTILDRKGYEAGTNLAYFEDPRGAHSEGDWARRMPKILSFLFGAPATTELA
jgi:predicted alpha/beta superfamily hydrolase